MENKFTDCTATNIELVKMVAKNMPDNTTLEGLSDFFKIMGDTTRIKILWALETSALCVSDIAVTLNMTKSAVSHQLKLLKTSKLVKAEKKGKNVFYSLDDDHIKDIIEKGMEHINE